MSEDPIKPVEIEHTVDEVWNGDRLEQRYYFLDYHFEREGTYCRARTYAEDFQTAILFGPFDRRKSIKAIANPTMLKDVIAYLERRFLYVSTR